MTEKTICMKCKFLIRDEVGTVRECEWYNFTCGASPVKRFNPVTGNTDKWFDWCKYVNMDGNCPLYQPLTDK